VVGFALKMDIKLLAAFRVPITTKIIDLQRVAVRNGIGSKRELPGLR